MGIVIKMWIARDPSGMICLHKGEPTLNRGIEGWASEDWIVLNEENFPEVTFENSPQKVELKFVNNV